MVVEGIAGDVWLYGALLVESVMLKMKRINGFGWYKQNRIKPHGGDHLSSPVRQRREHVIVCEM